MSNVGVTDPSPHLSPLPYQRRIRDYLKEEEPEVWKWYASNQARDEHADSIRFELLKSTYRVDQESQPELYAAASAAAECLRLDAPITIYQAHHPIGLNASMAYLPDEAHIVLHGPVSSKLDTAELQALMAHELSHFLLWQGFEGEYLVTDQILSAMTLDAGAAAVHHSSARLFRLYSEVFCDRGSLLAVEDPLVAVSMLVKIHTELEEVSPQSYVQQAEEIALADADGTDQPTHPEAFIRTRAIKLWSDQVVDAEDQIARMVEGSPSLDDLDLLGQRRVADATRILIDQFLATTAMRTDKVLAHAKLFFDDFQPSKEPSSLAKLQDEISSAGKLLRDYYCYVLLDFVTADRELEELPLAAALLLSEELGIKEPFSEIARRELRLRKRQFEKIDEHKTELAKSQAT